MAKSKDDVKYGTAQAKLSEDESLRVRYKAGTPLEGGKIVDSEPVDLFSSARNTDQGGKIADSEPVDLFSSARTSTPPLNKGAKHLTPPLHTTVQLQEETTLLPPPPPHLVDACMSRNQRRE
ncbi:uncharacterized protein LOC132314966 [Cornus florida]|uniref:uncharacterized protein LOC132314966 n=1 Tax=Cornus florida TaxID=4283 RepID=UPI0028A1CA63|nr:uncharacterized protein LOC132314966 [Cornus florida]